MIKVNIVCVGKLKEKYLKDACAEYQKRLTRFCRLEIKELPERQSLKEEAEDILKSLRGYVVALAVEGRMRSSEEFASDIGSLFDRGEELTLVIGSSCGLDSRVKEEADSLLSFSEMTFPHQLFRVLLLEQLYRAFMIGSGSEYHK